MRWNKPAKVERPEFPKLLPVSGNADEIDKLLALAQTHDPDAVVLDGGERGAYLKVHNSAGEGAITRERRGFPLA